jgi:hypothetical protein
MATVALVRAGIFMSRTLKIVDISRPPSELRYPRRQSMSQACPEHVDDPSLAYVRQPLE